MISRTIKGGDAVAAFNLLGAVSRVDDAVMDELLTAREALQTAFGWNKRKGWPFAVKEDRGQKTTDLEDADRTVKTLAFEGETLEAVLVGLVSLAERSKPKDGTGEIAGEVAHSVSQLHDCAATFGVRKALRQRLRERGGKVPAFSGQLDGDGLLVLDVDVQAPQVEG